MRASVRKLYKNHYVQLSAILTVATLLIFFRQPDTFLNPQFWAEDGIRWYSDAWNHGISSLFMTYAGSLQLLLRLSGYISTLGPLGLAPFFFLLVSVLIQLLPLAVAWSKRFESLIPNKWFLSAISLLYLLQPATLEVQTNLTNAGWHLALAGLLLILGPKPITTKQKVFDGAVLLVCALTGPFGLFLLPIVCIEFLYNRKDSWARLKLLIFVVCAAVQLAALFNAPRSATVSPGVIINNISKPAQIIGRQVVATTTIGHNTFGSQKVNQAATYVLFVWFCITCLIIFVIGHRSIRLSLLFALLLLFASLFRSQDGNLLIHWENFLIGLGGRYFYIPSLIWVTCLVWLLKIESWPLRGLILTTLWAIVFIAIPIDFRYPPMKDNNFNGYVTEFTRSATGETTCTDINPKTPDNAWKLCLKKYQ